MTTGVQYQRIQDCMAAYYCKVQKYECVGRPTDELMYVLKQLYISYKLYPLTGYSCVVECFLNKVCNC